MCGIVGYVGNRGAADVLLVGLKHLEYRGYDSAGIGVFINGRIEIKKSEGRLHNVERLINNGPKDSSGGNGEQDAFKNSHCGIGHTRWATHGKPTTTNAHPHKIGHVVLVHNGIIENYQEIKRELMLRGHHPVSETDSELFGFLVLEEMNQGKSLVEAVRKSFLGIHGQCSIVVISEKEPGVIVGVRDGSPLVAGIDPQGGAVLASDAQAIVPFTSKVLFLEEGDMVVGTKDGLKTFALKSGKEVKRTFTPLNWSAEKLDKSGYPHFTLKEIYEQPTTIADTLTSILDLSKNEPFPLVEQPALTVLKQAKEIVLAACGTSLNASMLGRYWIERLANIPVTVELASEFRYREGIIRPGTLVIGISQSGETADTLAVIRQMKKRGVPTLAITNVRGSSISREADGVLFTCAGPEIGVAATKTFTAQMLVFLLIAGYLGGGTAGAQAQLRSELFDQLIKLPHLVNQELFSPPNSTSAGESLSDKVKKIVDATADIRGFFFIGRGYSYPIALEAALKLKEVAYDYAEGYAAGELKHGPIAMIDEGILVVVLAPRDPWRDKTVSNLEEVRARRATIFGIGDPDDHDLRELCHHWIPLPKESQDLDIALLPFLIIPIVQLLSYYRAVLKGTDVDKPRNLAKSVTVE